MATVSEASLQRKIQQALRARGAYVYKTHGSAFGSHGAPDLLVCADGKFYAFEVKRPGHGNRATKSQRYHIHKIQDASGIAAVVTSVEETLKIITQNSD